MFFVKTLVSLFYIRLDINNRLYYSQKKDLSIGLGELN